LLGGAMTDRLPRTPPPRTATVLLGGAMTDRLPSEPHLPHFVFLLNLSEQERKEFLQSL
jgi:hypothetical protein